jgi:hypothetical protein
MLMATRSLLSELFVAVTVFTKIAFSHPARKCIRRVIYRDPPYGSLSPQHSSGRMPNGHQLGKVRPVAGRAFKGNVPRSFRERALERFSP